MSWSIPAAAVVVVVLVAAGCSGARPELAAAPDPSGAPGSSVSSTGGSRPEQPGDRTAAVVADAARRALAGAGAQPAAASSPPGSSAQPVTPTDARPAPDGTTAPGAAATAPAAQAAGGGPMTILVGLPPVTPADAPAPAPPPAPAAPEGRTVLTAPGVVPAVTVTVTVGDRPAVGLGTDLGTITTLRPDCVTVDRADTPAGVTVRMTCPAPDGAVEHLLLHAGVVVQRAVNRPPSGVDVTPAVYEAIEPGMSEVDLLAVLPPCDLGSEHRIEGVLRRSWVCHNADGAIAVFELTDGLLREKLEFGVL